MPTGNNPGGPGSPPPFWQQPWFNNLLDFVGQAGSTYYASQSQERANSRNIAQQREQRQWEETMSNTAVQRRADDIEKAGGNRALAFESGASASTPSISPARVDPTFAGMEMNLGARALAMAQMQNVQANTALTTQKARQEKEVADWMTSPDMREGGKLSHYQTERIAKLVTTKMQALRAEVTKDLSEAQLNRFNDATDAVIQTIKTQAEKGKIELEQIKSVIETFGLGANQKAGLLKTAMQILQTITGAK